MSNLRRCPDEGSWRAYLDGELLPVDRAAFREHLAACAACAALVSYLQGRANLVRGALAQVPVSEQPSSRAAWARFRARYLAPARHPLRWRLRTMWQNLRTRNWRPALVGSLLAALIVSVLAFAPLRTAASEFLGIFRVRKFAVVSFDPTRIRDLAGFEEEVFGQPEVGDLRPVEVGSAEEAGRLAGFRVLVPTHVPASLREDAPRISVTGATAARTRVNLAAARALLQMAGLPTDAIPTDRDMVEVTAQIPPIVTLTYGNGPDSLAVIQARSPEVNVPEGIDLARVGEVGLQLLGLSPQEARRLSRSIDWATTLVIPVPKDIASVREVTVRGVPAYLIHGSVEDPDGVSYVATLVWEADGLLYAVIGDTGMAELVEVAESLR
jgi:anti-sigma factor RsiW